MFLGTDMEHHDEFEDPSGPADSPADSASGESGGSTVPDPASAQVMPGPKAVPNPSAPDSSRSEPTSPAKGKVPNNVRRHRIERMMSKAELARRANLSVLTIDRVEKGFGCRMDSKRKILEALGLSLADRVRVFGEEE